MRLKSYFPDMERVVVKVVETNAWPPSGAKEFCYVPDSEANLHIDCPMSKCLGAVRGIDLWPTLAGMIHNRETHKKARLTCRGYGGYNLTFHCDWYAVFDLTVYYHTPEASN